MREESTVRRELQELQVQLDSVVQQLDAAKAKAASTGEYADDNWFTRAKHAKRVIGRNIGRLQTELGEIRRSQKAAASKQSVSFERQFMYKAKELLPKATYDLIFTAANESL